jgi:hypothetical protein
MTVGIGFECLDGVVLAADRQITKTGGLKYEEEKIFRGYYDRVQCACTYSGNPAKAKNLFDDIFKALRFTFGKRLIDDAFPTDVFKRTVEGVLRKHKNTSIEMLITFRAPGVGIPPFLLCARGQTVVTSPREYIGVGDSSVLRYVAELTSCELSVKQAQILAIYMVSLAGRFIDGCGGMNVLVMPADGDMKLLSKREIDKFTKVLIGINKSLSDALIKLL